MNAVHAGLTVLGIVVVTVSLVMRRGRKRVRGKNRARRAAGGAWGTGRVQDRRALWARRYGAGAAWTAGAVTLGGIDGVGDHHATCSGSAGMVSGNCGGGVGDGVGCGGGAGCRGGCGGGGGGCGGGS